MSGTAILSIGVDVGTTTTQVVFARLLLENTAGYLSVPHIAIVHKEIIYRSEIYLTPLLDGNRLHGAALKSIVAQECEKADISPAMLDTGAVIITGEAVKKENAALLLDTLSEFAGEFVVSCAGPDLESVLAGKGSGAQKYSQKNDLSVANLDIGGGTTNIIIFDSGEPVSKGCLDIGGRLIRLTPEGVVLSVSPSAKRIAEADGIALKVGARASLGQLRQVCCSMAGLLEQALGFSPPSPLLREMQTRHSSRLSADTAIQAVCFSGGVADCIETPRADPFCYGDIGPLLGDAIRNSRLYRAAEVIPAQETIRATVIGAGSFSTTVSGSTVAQDEGALPLKNIPALKLTREEEARCYRGDGAFLSERAGWFLEQSDAAQMILAFRGERNPSYESLRRLAAAIKEMAQKALPAGAPILVALESDTAKALGQMLRRQIKERPVVCIDEIHIEQGDYVDLGKPLMNGLIIPVVIKTLALG